MIRSLLPLFCFQVTLVAAGHPQPPIGFRQVVLPEDEGFSSARLARIDSLIEPLVKRGELPGAVVFLARNGRVVLHKAYGYRDLETRTPLKGDDIFRIASQSKAIALAVMMLWEEGRFGFDDPIERYIPEFAKPTVLTRFNQKDTTWEAEPARRSSASCRSGTSQESGSPTAWASTYWVTWSR